ncbi:MAG: orotate phosphoribosyltransferase [Aquiluna sp.]
MTSPAQDKLALAQLVSELAVVHGKVTLSSGIEADYYVDLRRATLHHEAAVLVGKVMLDLLSDAGLSPDAVGGLTMGADPVATAMLHQANARDMSLDAFVVRKEAKKHGMARQVEGPDISGKNVVILEDTSTTGGSPLAAAKAAEEAGAKVLAIATVVDRDTGARAAIESAGYAYYSALSLSDLGL